MVHNQYFRERYTGLGNKKVFPKYFMSQEKYKSVIVGKMYFCASEELQQLLTRSKALTNSPLHIKNNSSSTAFSTCSCLLKRNLFILLKVLHKLWHRFTLTEGQLGIGVDFLEKEGNECLSVFFLFACSMIINRIF